MRTLWVKVRNDPAYERYARVEGASEADDSPWACLMRLATVRSTLSTSTTISCVWSSDVLALMAM